MTNIRHTSEDQVTNFRGPSVAIFGDLQYHKEQADMGKCVVIDDDFACPTNHATTSASGGYYTFQDTGSTITGKGVNDLGKELGVLELSGDGTLNDETDLQFGYGNQWRIGNSDGNTGFLAWEARLGVNTVVDNACAFAVGLYEGPVADSGLTDLTGEVKTSTSFIGFRSLNDDGDKVDFVYQDTGASAVVSILANAVSLTANQYVRVGMKYDPSATADRKITAYVDGNAVAYVNTTQIDTSTFPEDEGMVPAVLLKTLEACPKLSLDRFTFVAYMDSVDE